VRNLPRTLAWLLAAAMVLAPALAMAQADTMTLNDTKVFKTPARAPVVFTHLTHMGLDGVDCTECHHRYEGGLPPKGKNVLDARELEEGNPDILCSSCHRTPAALQKAFHAQCIDCHEKLLAAGKPTGPRLCGECHAWK
jgi:c(7)-type cytochrome triheme protein